MERDGVPFYGPDPFNDPYGGAIDDEFGSWSGEGSDEDVAAVAREARAMAQMMGEPLDADFDSALRHVEAGADPDDVFGELDVLESARERSPVDDDP